MGKKEQKESFFWTSYSDLMTSLFFVMLVLFILMVAVFSRENATANAEAEASKAQLQKIREIQEATQNLDEESFRYNTDYKKHILNYRIKFPSGEYDIYGLSFEDRQALFRVGKYLKDFIAENIARHPGLQYILVVEGQASGGMYSYVGNDELSYKRALALKEFWEARGIKFSPKTCELLVCGSGEGGVPRDRNNERNNQRFLIHIIPKPGTISQ